MTNQEFKLWLSGYFSLTEDLILNSKQINIIKNHANLAKSMNNNFDENIMRFIVILEKYLLKNSQLIVADIKRQAELNFISSLNT